MNVPVAVGIRAQVPLRCVVAVSNVHAAAPMTAVASASMSS